MAIWADGLLEIPGITGESSCRLLLNVIEDDNYAHRSMAIFVDSFQDIAMNPLDLTPLVRCAFGNSEIRANFHALLH